MMHSDFLNLLKFMKISVNCDVLQTRYNSSAKDNQQHHQWILDSMEHPLSEQRLIHKATSFGVSNPFWKPRQHIVSPLCGRKQKCLN